MILAFDVQYFEDQAKAVAIAFDRWEDEKPSEIFIKEIQGIAAYEPGAFYKRELPCILAILEHIDLASIDFIVVDGYVHLDDAGKLGLGGHLFETLNHAIPIIGVAKTKFLQNTNNAMEVLRGESQKPLYISTIGVAMQEAALWVKNMHGDYRLPTLLKLLDDITKRSE